MVRSNYAFMMKYFLGLILFTTSFVSLQAQQDTLPQPVAADTVKPAFTFTGKKASGLAGIYDADLDGMRTASGESLLHVRLTAAANSFPLNTWLLVTNTSNKRSVILRINDRLTKKQQSRGTVINLTREAAAQLGIKKSNSSKIKMESILPVDSLSFTNFYSDTSLAKDSLQRSFKPAGKAITGIASYYSANLDGTLTSTGERYRNFKLTAASNHFKLNTWVEVTNLRNHRSVIVRINDRMHPRMKKKGRVVDMSQEAARELDYMEEGLTRVRVQPITFISADSVQPGDSIVINLDSLRIRDSIRIADSIAGHPGIPEANFKTGTASYYSAHFDGRKTANGEIFRNSKMTAASNDFDLNTWVRVTNLVNQRSVIVWINDRMHRKMQQKGRVVDLSRAAARELGFIKAGLVKVTVEVVEPGTQE